MSANFWATHILISVNKQTKEIPLLSDGNAEELKVLFEYKYFALVSSYLEWQGRFLYSVIYVRFWANFRLVCSVFEIRCQFPVSPKLILWASKLILPVFNEKIIRCDFIICQTEDILVSHCPLDWLYFEHWFTQIKPYLLSSSYMAGFSCVFFF